MYPIPITTTFYAVDEEVFSTNDLRRTVLHTRQHNEDGYTTSSRYLKDKFHLKLLMSQSKFSGPRKFPLV